MSTAPADNERAALSREWIAIFTALREEAAATAPIVKNLTLKNPEAGHPYFLGKVALLDYLLSLAESDLRDALSPDDLRLVRAGPSADGGFEVVLRTQTAHHLAALMAGWFKDHGGMNYVELSLYSEELGPLVFTMQRVLGRTPHQLRQDAETQNAVLIQRIAELEAELERLKGAQKEWA